MFIETHSCNEREVRVCTREHMSENIICISSYCKGAFECISLISNVPTCKRNSRIEQRGESTRVCKVLGRRGAQVWWSRCCGGPGGRCRRRRAGRARGRRAARTWAARSRTPAPPPCPPCTRAPPPCSPACSPRGAGCATGGPSSPLGTSRAGGWTAHANEQQTVNSEHWDTVVYCTCSSLKTCVFMRSIESI